MSADVMMKRQAELEAKYEAMWDGGKGSHHPDYDPSATGDDVVKASRETEELLKELHSIFAATMLPSCDVASALGTVQLLRHRCQLLAGRSQQVAAGGVPHRSKP